MNQALRKCQDVTWEGQREGSADLQGSCRPPQPGENGSLAFDATRLSPSPADQSVILKRDKTCLSHAPIVDELEHVQLQLGGVVQVCQHQDLQE